MSKKQQQSKSAKAAPAQHSLTLNGVPETDVYRAELNGKAIIVAFHTRNRAKESDQFKAITLREGRLDQATALAKTEKAAPYVAVEITVGEKWASGWLIPMALYRKFKQCETDFVLSQKARAAYTNAAEALTGVHFEIKEAQ